MRKIPPPSELSDHYPLASPQSMSSVTLTGEEAALYDRQIRLWGVDAQQRLRSARVLLCGLSAVQSEVCKNLVLAGIQSLTLNDTKITTDKDLAANLFLDRASLGKAVRKLISRQNTPASPSPSPFLPFSSASSDEEYNRLRKSL